MTLEFTLTNLSAQAASAIGFTEDLSAMLAGTTYDSLLLNDCAGDQLGKLLGHLRDAGGVERDLYLELSHR